MKLSLSSLFFLISFPLLSTTLHAQVGGIWTTYGEATGYEDREYFASQICGVGDVNLDGTPDYMVAAPNATVAGQKGVGRAVVYADGTQQVLFQILGDVNNRGFASAIDSAGDVNADGYPDFILGNWRDGTGEIERSGVVEVRSGQSGMVLYRSISLAPGAKTGMAVAGIGDVNQDGYDDFMFSRKGKVNVVSGKSGSNLLIARGSSENKFGLAVAGVGDVNQDGYPDFVIGEPYWSRSGQGINHGRAQLWSGRTLEIIHHFEGDLAHEHLGSQIASGDINNDGHNDILLATRTGVRIYSGRNFSFLRAHAELEHSSPRDCTVSAAGDFDNDGFADYWVGLPPAHDEAMGRLTVYSGATAEPLFTHFDKPALGARLSHDYIGDLNGDGADELLFGSSAFTSPGSGWNTGVVRVVGLQPGLRAGVKTVSARKGGNVVFAIDFPWETRLQEFRVLMSATGSETTRFGIDIPLSRDRVLVDSMHGVYPVRSHWNLHGVLDGSGDALASFAFPKRMHPSMIGKSFWFAAITGPAQTKPTLSSVAVQIKIVT